jgi:hypothetical protein
MWKFFFELYTFTRGLSLKKRYFAAFLDSGGIQNFLNGCGAASERRFIDQFAATRIQSFHFCMSFEILPLVLRELLPRSGRRLVPHEISKECGMFGWYLRRRH